MECLNLTNLYDHLIMQLLLNPAEQIEMSGEVELGKFTQFKCRLVHAQKKKIRVVQNAKLFDCTAFRCSHRNNRYIIIYIPYKICDIYPIYTIYSISSAL